MGTSVLTEVTFLSRDGTMLHRRQSYSTALKAVPSVIQLGGITGVDSGTADTVGIYLACHNFVPRSYEP